ncbi:sensor histidine kinase [Sphingomonas sp. DT-51]|uniref:sensor histidine kinase n=1 Tax=Sphingomonas sp. DT-51 TaxID=3396165 RepID=UPI003F1B0F07
MTRMRYPARVFVARRPALLLAALAVVVLGILAYAGAAHWTRQRALDQVQDEALRTARQQARLIDSELAKFRLLPIVLSEYGDLREALTQGATSRAATRLDDKLALLARRTGAPVIYAIDAHGLTVSASNAASAQSFVGHDYRFRPYFQQAMRDGAAEHFALGNVSGRPGLFMARRIDAAGAPLGVVVVKVEFDAITRAWANDPGQTLLADERGVVLAATDRAAALHLLAPIAPATLAAIRRSGQFLDRPLAPVRYRFTSAQRATGPSGAPLLVATVPAAHPGWRLLHLVPVARALREAAYLARLATATAVLLTVLIAALLLWRTSQIARAAADRTALEQAVAARTAELSAAMARREDADRRFRAAREELAQANRLASLGSITAGLAHEINQPVATIRTLAENARHHLAQQRTERVAASLDSAVALTERIGTITQEMRRFARRGSGTAGPIALDDVIDGTRLLVGDRLRAVGVALDWPAPGQPRVFAGRVRLEQVLVNLINNAVDALAGRTAPRIALTVATREEWVELTVADNGPGIDPALGDEVFSPFVTGRPDGLGLGLGIARDIIAQFDGSLRIVPSALGGAAFRATVRRA